MGTDGRRRARRAGHQQIRKASVRGAHGSGLAGQSDSGMDPQLALSVGVIGRRAKERSISPGGNGAADATELEPVRGLSAIDRWRGRYRWRQPLNQGYAAFPIKSAETEPAHFGLHRDLVPRPVGLFAAFQCDQLLLAAAGGHRRRYPSCIDGDDCGSVGGGQADAMRAEAGCWLRNRNAVLAACGRSRTARPRRRDINASPGVLASWRTEGPNPFGTRIEEPTEAPSLDGGCFGALPPWKGAGSVQDDPKAPHR